MVTQMFYTGHPWTVAASASGLRVLTRNVPFFAHFSLPMELGAELVLVYSPGGKLEFVPENI